MLLFISIPDSKVHGANMGPTWVLPAPDGPHVVHMNLTIRGYMCIDASIKLSLLAKKVMWPLCDAVNVLFID